MGSLGGGSDRVACIPLVYGRSVAYVKPWVHGWWESPNTFVLRIVYKTSMQPVVT